MKRKKRVVHNDGTESNLERQFQGYWLSLFPAHPPTPQFRFHHTRLWLFDFAWPQHRVAVEVQGMGPGHCSLVGMTKDYDKLLAALLLDWKVVYLTKRHLETYPRAKELCFSIASLLKVPRPQRTGYIPVSQRKFPK